MSKIYISSELEKQLLENAKKYLLSLTIGTGNVRNYTEFYKGFSNALKTVRVIPYGSRSEEININCPGICISNFIEGTATIEMYGFKNRDFRQYQAVKHEFTHEYSHALCNYLGHLSEPDGKKVRTTGDGETYTKRNCGGSLMFTNDRTEENHAFGVMFSETFADMLTTMALIAFDPEYPLRNVTVDTVLTQHVNNWGDDQTGYSIFTSLTRLMIAAFSNAPTINYQTVVNAGQSICTINAITNAGRKVRANDFLYGMVFNPMEIERKYDFFMGNGAFLELCSRIDKVFNEYLRTNVYTTHMKEEIKYFMTVLSHFCNAKKKYNLACGIWDINDANAAVSNYNKVWNKLQSEYSSFFTPQDIAEIYRKAAEPLVVRLPNPQIPKDSSNTSTGNKIYIKNNK